MAVVLGTNAGFVATAPAADPASGTTLTMDATAKVVKDVSPSTAGLITEIGRWCNEATQESNFEVGLYAANGATVPGEAGTLLQVSRTNAKGTTSGRKVVTGLNRSISPSTNYRIGVQLDNTTTTTTLDTASTGGLGIDTKASQTTLTNPWGGGALSDVDGMYSIYAVWAEAPASNTPSGSLLMMGCGV